MLRAAHGVAAAFGFIGIALAHAQAGPTPLTVDVMDLNEGPDQAISRMDKNRRQAVVKSRSRGEVPDIPAALVEDPLALRAAGAVAPPDAAVLEDPRDEHIKGPKSPKPHGH